MQNPTCPYCGNAVPPEAVLCPACGNWWKTDPASQPPPSPGHEARKGLNNMPAYLKALYVGVIVVTLVWVGWPTSTGSGDRASPAASERTRSYGEIIAAEMEGDLSPDPVLVRRFEALITALNARCAGDRETISDQILSGHRTLMSRGGRASLLDVAVGYERGTRDISDLGVDCPEAFAGVMVLLEKG